MDPLQLLPGLLHKSVWVFVQGQTAPAVTFSPPYFGFGRIERGTVLTLLLKATPRRLNPRIKWKWTCASTRVFLPAPSRRV